MLSDGQMMNLYFTPSQAALGPTAMLIDIPIWAPAHMPVPATTAIAGAISISSARAIICSFDFLLNFDPDGGTAMLRHPGFEKGSLPRQRLPHLNLVQVLTGGKAFSAIRAVS